jgi:hypothetical protein
MKVNCRAVEIQCRPPVHDEFQAVELDNDVELLVVILIDHEAVLEPGTPTALDGKTGIGCFQRHILVGKDCSEFILCLIGYVQIHGLAPFAFYFILVVRTTTHTPFSLIAVPTQHL